MRIFRAAVVIVAAAAAILTVSRFPATYIGAGTQSPQGTYGLPSPSYWPLSPFPAGSVQPQPVVSIKPCAQGETLVNRGSYYECLATIPPDPQTGPQCVAADGHTYPPIKKPDGSYDCG